MTGFGFFQFLAIGQKISIPLHTVVETAEFILRIWRIDGDQIKVLELCSNDSAFCVVMLDIDAVGDTERLVLGENEGT